jgi:hypothetical protein
MNNLERSWAAILNVDKGVRRWVWQGTRLRLAKGTYYTPDFTVFKTDGLIEQHECKGFMREAARVRINTSAELYPEFLFVLIRKKGGVWKVDPVPGSGTP